MDRQTDRQTDRPKDRQTGRQTDRPTDRQTLWFIGKLHLQESITLVGFVYKNPNPAGLKDADQAPDPKTLIRLHDFYSSLPVHGCVESVGEDGQAHAVLRDSGPVAGEAPHQLVHSSLAGGINMIFF